MISEYAPRPEIASANGPTFSSFEKNKKMWETIMATESKMATKTF
jgi:hypothetical protein